MRSSRGHRQSPMFWFLLFAHLLADYPLQTDWMLVAKRKWPGLLLHAGIHFAALLVVVGPDRNSIWAFLLLLAASHYLIDALKNRLAERRPSWVLWPYLIDQFLHLVAIIWVASWIEGSVAADLLPRASAWEIYAVGLVLSTHVWYITERFLVMRNEAYLQAVNQQAWHRMIARGLLFLVFLSAARVLLPFGILAAAQLPYLSWQFGRRALIIDVSVAGGIAGILLILG